MSLPGPEPGLQNFCSPEMLVQLSTGLGPEGGSSLPSHSSSVLVGGLAQFRGTLRPPALLPGSLHLAVTGSAGLLACTPLMATLPPPALASSSSDPVLKDTRHPALPSWFDVSCFLAPPTPCSVPPQNSVSTSHSKLLPRIPTAPPSPHACSFPFLG